MGEGSRPYYKPHTLPWRLAGAGMAAVAGGFGRFRRMAFEQAGSRVKFPPAPILGTDSGIAPPQGQ